MGNITNIDTFDLETLVFEIKALSELLEASLSPRVGDGVAWAAHEVAHRSRRLSQIFSGEGVSTQP